MTTSDYTAAATATTPPAIVPSEDTPPAPRQTVVDAIPMVAIIGRPNVGKSSLFNRILSRRHAIVSPVAGTTRDRLISRASWKGRPFLLVDTGGLEDDPEGHIPQRVQQQADMAMSAAAVIVFLADAIQGVTATDEAVAQRLRRTDKPVILAVNKVDNDNREIAAAEFYGLGMPETAFISAYHNYGIYDLLERIVELLPTPELADLWDWDADGPDTLPGPDVGYDEVQADADCRCGRRRRWRHAAHRAARGYCGPHQCWQIPAH